MSSMLLGLKSCTARPQSSLAYCVFMYISDLLNKPAPVPSARQRPAICSKAWVPTVLAENADI